MHSTCYYVVNSKFHRVTRSYSSRPFFWFGVIWLRLSLSLYQDEGLFPDHPTAQFMRTQLVQFLHTVCDPREESWGMTLENVRQKALWNKQPQSTIALLVNSADGCLDTEHFPHTDEQTVNSQRCLVSLSKLSNNGLLPETTNTQNIHNISHHLYSMIFTQIFFSILLLLLCWPL